MIETSGEGGSAWLTPPLGGINSSLKERESMYTNMYLHMCTKTLKRAAFECIGRKSRMVLSCKPHICVDQTPLSPYACLICLHFKAFVRASRLIRGLDLQPRKKHLLNSC